MQFLIKINLENHLKIFPQYSEIAVIHIFIQVVDLDCLVKRQFKYKLGRTVKDQTVDSSIHTLRLSQHFMDYTVKEVHFLLYHNNKVVTFCNP